MPARGFTLLELLVVLAVIGLILAAVPGFLVRDQGRLGLEAAARALADGLRQTRSEAMFKNREQVFALDLENRRFRVARDRALRQLDQDVELSLLTAQSEILDANAGTIRFFADGTSTGGRVRLALADHRAEVRVDWLTGRITVHGPEPAP